MNIEPNLLREASRQSLITFVERALLLLIAGYVPFTYVSLIAAKVEEPVIAGQSKRLVINLPPRHGKSFTLIADRARPRSTAQCTS